MLKNTGTAYRSNLTRPTRDFFKTDEELLYVIRAKSGEDGILEITLAGRLANS